MPKLRLKKDGAFCINRKLPYGGFERWQIKTEVIGILKSKKIHIPTSTRNEDFGEVKEALFRNLRDQGLVYVRGEGRKEDWLESVPTSSNHVQLAFQEGISGWKLVLVASEINEAWIQSSWSDKCSFAIHADDNFFRSVRLSQCHEKILEEVKPQVNPYRVEARGGWPTTWAMRPGTLEEVLGLRTDGTLFAYHEQGGLKLKTGQIIYPEQTYYFVASRGEPPQELSVRRYLGADGIWHAWEIALDATTDEDKYDAVCDWCESISHPLRTLPWRLSLLSPPASSWVQDVPVFQLGSRVIVKMLMPTDLIQGAEAIELEVRHYGKIVATTQLIKQACSLVFAPSSPGQYTLRARSGGVVPIKFFIVSPSQAALEYPRPLHVQLLSGEQEFHFSAFDHQVDVTDRDIYEVILPKLTVPSFHIDCPTPVKIVWSCGSHKGEVDEIEAALVQEYLASYLELALQQKHLFDLIIDAGAFGLVHLRLNPPGVVPSNESLSVISWEVAQRLRWLAIALKRQTPYERMVPLSSMMRAKLTQLSEIYHEKSLSGVLYIPQSLLPHIYAWFDL